MRKKIKDSKMVYSNSFCRDGQKIKDILKSFSYCLICLFMLQALIVAKSPKAFTSEADLPKIDFSFDGPFGTFDKAQLQRGLKIYRQVCASCHKLENIAFRNLSSLGYSNDQILAIAAEYEFEDGPDDEGEMFSRLGKISDKFPNPYKNDAAARASNFGANPPDLSTIVKARKGGADYIYAILTGYTNPPSSLTLTPGQNYNIYFPGNVIAMASQLSDDLIEYQDKSMQNTDQYAKDISAFLYWASHPKMEERQSTGIKVILFLIFSLIVSIFLKNFYWKNLISKSPAKSPSK